MLERLSSGQSFETVESDRLGSESGGGSTLEQRIDRENYHEIWDKISSDLDEIIRNTNKCDRLGYNNSQDYQNLLCKLTPLFTMLLCFKCLLGPGQTLFLLK